VEVPKKGDNSSGGSERSFLASEEKRGGKRGGRGVGGKLIQKVRADGGGGLGASAGVKKKGGVSLWAYFGEY